jgi:DNA/RNA endonuclease G (NUC1)
VASTTSSATNRIVGRVDANGNVDTTTRIGDGYSANNIRGAVTDDGTRFWTGGTASTAAAGGVRFVPFGNASATPTAQISATTTNVRVPNIFNGQLYVSSGSGSSVGVNTVGSGLPTTSGQAMALIAGSGNATGYVLLDRDASVAGPDTLYIADQTSGLIKYSFNGTTWTARGSVAGSLTGLTGIVSGNNAVLYATSGTSAANSLVTFTDTAAFNANVAASATTLATAAASTIFRGLAFAPLSAAPVAPSISKNPQSQTINSGTTATMSVTASGTAPLTYQWYVGNSGDTTSPIGGATANSYTTSILTSTATYWVRVSNAQGSADSATATITVNAAVAPSITTNPVSQAISSGQTATLTVVASGTAPLSYQWYQGTSGDVSTPVGTNSSSFTTPALTATTSYWVRISNGQNPPADSATATITVLTSTPPVGTGSAVPSSIPAGGTTTLTVNVTPGTNPTSTGLSVTGDLSSIGGSSAQVFQASGNTFTFSAIVDVATTTGAKTLPLVVSDAEGRSTGFNISLTVTGPLANSTVVISQLYAGGGNTSTSTYTNDFVQLYNRGTTTVDLSGWSLQYSSATNTGDWSGRMPLGGTIGAGQYYLIALAPGTTPNPPGGPLPAPNVSGQINMGQSAGKIALVDNGDLLSGQCPSFTHVKDFVGYGSTANCFEGSGPATVPAALTSTALFRLGDGFIDTNDNKADFVVATPNAFTTAPIIDLPPAVFTTYPASSGLSIPRDATIEVTFTEAVTLDSGWFDITCATTSAHDDVTEAPDGVNHWITPNVNFAAGETCTVTVFKTKVHDASSLMPTQDYSWSFTVASGAPPPETADVHLLMGNPTGAVADINQPNNYLMSKPEYALSYNRDLGRPNWVSWHLTDAWIPFVHPGRVDTFRPDPAVPPDWYRVQSFDFSGSGFDRGHMDPNADREDTVPDNQATFLMSNMVAQAPNNNQGPWADLENYLRLLVHGTSQMPSAVFNEIYIVSGPAGTGGTGSNGGVTTTIAGGHVTVPAYTWKVALVLPDNGNTNDISRVDCSATALAVIMPNTQFAQGLNSDWTTYITTVNAVETLTGYHFFTNLPQPIQTCLKAGINGANPKNNQTISFAPFSGGVGDFVPLQATASSGLAVTFAVTGPGTINGSTLHITDAGLVTVTATQAGDVNYNAAPNVSQTIAVARAAAVISVTGGTFLYDGQPHGLSGTATGVFGEDLSGLLTLGPTFVNAPGGHVQWVFAGNTNYLPSNGSADVTIMQAGAPAAFFEPGNLVVAVEGNGVPGAASGPYTDNQAGPLTLFQYAPNGTSSATYVSSLVLPQFGSGANLPVSGEYGSSSEGTLQLSGLGNYLTIAGYGITAAAFNANPASYGSTDPSKPNALAQSGSLTGANYTPVPRVVALIDPYGNVNSSTALVNVFNTNNPRSVYTADGRNIYISGQGTGNDLTGGVFYAALGSSSATAITGATASVDGSGPNTIAQDVRDVQIVGNQLYASIDTKEGKGSNRDYIGTLGPAGVPPTGLVGAPVRLPGFGNNGGTGKFTITAATTNGINSIGQEINLSPVSYFFANSTTLYVADSGFPKNDSATNDPNGVTLGNGGLQKWVLSGGTWSLKYTLGLQNGLPLVPNSSASGVSGLYGLTGKVVGSEVLLYATTYSITDLDQTYLFGFTDFLDATTNPGTSFMQLAMAPVDSNFKGVAFAPAAPSGSVTITSSPFGMAFTSAGAGCAPGSYTTPVTLIWTPGSACTLSTASPQAGEMGVEYQLRQWDDGSGSQTRSVTAPATPTVYNATFDTYYQLTTSAGMGGAVSAGGFVLAGTDATITATPDADYAFTTWMGNVASATSASTTITMNGPQSVTATFHALITPVITWPTPADIVFGTPLGGAQLNAAAGATGSFSYTPAAGTVLNAGDGQFLSVTFTPDDPNTYASATATVSINVLKETPSITWSNPADIVYGIALGNAQLNATANKAGTFSYSPAAGTVLNAGNAQTLSLTFTPSDTANFNSKTANVSINVLKAPSSTVVACGAGPFVYTGSAIAPCSATVTGVGGLSQTLPVMYVNNTNVGTASAGASYGGDGNHTLSSGSTTFTISRLNAALSLSNLIQPYDGTPKPVTATVSPVLCGVALTYNGSTSVPVLAGTYSVVASVTNANCAGSVNGMLTIFVSGVVRHAPSLNSGGVHGSLEVLLPESFTVNGSTSVTGDLLVPGTPTVKVNGHPTYGGTIDGAGSASPSGQTITLSSNVTMNHVVRRTDPILMPAVSAPPAPTGTRDVVLNAPGQDPGSFSTIRNLTLNSGVGQVVVPPGTYGNFSANANSGFTLGVPGATTPAVYNLQQLVVNGGARIDIVGPVVITIASGVNFSGTVGTQAHPEWLTLAIYSGGVTLNGISVYGYVVVPAGAVNINGNSALHGGMNADSLTVNSSGLLDLIPR